MDDRRNEMPRWDEVPDLQIVEVERETPVERPVPMVPVVLDIWTPAKKESRPN